MRMKPAMVAVLGAVSVGVSTAAAIAEPARIILLRHAEKKNSRDLCDVGKLRAQALSDQYLGKGAPGNETIYGKGGRPDAFFAITAHTRETATPSAESWGMEPILFPVPPKDPDEESDLDTQTRKAATALASASYDGKIVVVVWEHKRIANKELNQDGKTLWALLKLGEIPDADAPQTWKGANYDYFWIIDTTTSPPTFTPVKQRYTALPMRRSPTTNGASMRTRAGFRSSTRIARTNFRIEATISPCFRRFSDIR